MSVTVIATSGGVHTFERADGWHIDDERQLHVKEPNENSGWTHVGAYAVGMWASVTKNDDPRSD